MTEERVAELKLILEDIEFENKSKYEFRFFGSYRVALDIKRKLLCNVTNEIKYIHNGISLPNNVSNDNFIKLVFVAVGQFEAHEFVESFKYKGVNAYYPHSVNGKVKTLYGESEQINHILLQPWRHVVLERSYFRIGFHYIGRGIFKINGHIINGIEYTGGCVETAIMFPIRYIRSRVAKPTEANSETGE
jgi:hypothetical protein